MEAMLDLSNLEVQFAIQVVREGADVARQVRSELMESTLTKDDRSPVTVADFAIQALVGGRLAQAFPNDPLVAEETPEALRAEDGRAALEKVCEYVRRFAEIAHPDQVCDWIELGAGTGTDRYWTLDPIDGTKGYLRGGQYAVCLALIEEGRVQLGVLGCPNLKYTDPPEVEGPGMLLVAQRNRGAWTAPLNDADNFSPLNVSDRTDPSEARLLQSFVSGHTNNNQMQEIMQVLKSRREPFRLDSQAKYALLAAGLGDLLFKLLSRSNYIQKIWDHAPGSLIVEEAGGQVTDLEGKELDFAAGRTLARNNGVLASNGHLHAAALEAFQQIRADLEDSLVE
ncbi:MAG: 3'(2'),5'-bisphosphate nucleotidase [Acidobacteriota bacterium]